VALQLVRRSSDTLRKLCLLGRFLDEDEVKEVVDIFARLIDILAAGLPALRALSLVLEQYNEVSVTLSYLYSTY
jgi:hypothetical protein